MAYRLSQGSVVLVTGFTGLIGSAAAFDLGKRGYKIRGVTRDASKAQALAGKLEQTYGKGVIDVVTIKDSSVEAYIAALQGATGVLHIASDLSLSSDVEQVLEAAKRPTLHLLEAASRVPSIESFVLCSSCVSVYNPETGKEYYPKLDEFADYALSAARSLPDDDPGKGGMAYVASKVEAERAAWEFVKQNKPSFAFNVILPFLNAGPIFNPAPGTYSTVTWIRQFFENDSASVFPGLARNPALMVDVRDVAVLHTAALLSKEVSGQRLWGGGHPYHINEVLRIWRQAFPEKKDFPANFDYPPAPKQVIDNSISTRLLKEFEGRDWIPFEQSLLDTVKDLA